MVVGTVSIMAFSHGEIDLVTDLPPTRRPGIDRTAGSPPKPPSAAIRRAAASAGASEARRAASDAARAPGRLPVQGWARRGCCTSARPSRCAIACARTSSRAPPSTAAPAEAAVDDGLAQTVEYILTDSPIQALIWENDLVRKEQPRYNTKLRDDKHYPYVRIDVQNPWPVARVTAASRRTAPAISGRSRTRPRCVRRSTHSAGCSRRSCAAAPSPATIRAPASTTTSTAARRRASAPSTTRRIASSSTAWSASWTARTSGVLQELEREMEQAAENLEFERAADLRDRLRSATQGHRAGEGRLPHPGRPGRARLRARRGQRLRAVVLHPRRQARPARRVPDAGRRGRERPRRPDQLREAVLLAARRTSRSSCCCQTISTRRTTSPSGCGR